MGPGIPRAGAGAGLSVALRSLAGLGGGQGRILPSVHTRAPSSPSLLTPQVPPGTHVQPHPQDMGDTGRHQAALMCFNKPWGPTAGCGQVLGPARAALLPW